MPIYAYKCASCGYAKDVLQKISDPRLTVCPQCGKPTLQKQVTAAGFQLKGTGWYVTDFRGGSGGASSPAMSESHDSKAEAGPGHAQGEAKADQTTAQSKSESSSGGATPAASSTPASPAPSSSGGAAGSD